MWMDIYPEFGGVLLLKGNFLLKEYISNTTVKSRNIFVLSRWLVGGVILRNAMAPFFYAPTFPITSINNILRVKN